MVKELFGVLSGRWSFPSGYMNKSEQVSDAMEREVLEETGINTEYCGLVSVHEVEDFIFGSGGLLIVGVLKPLSKTINRCENELEACEWKPINEAIDMIKNQSIGRDAIVDVINYLKSSNENKRNIWITHKGKKIDMDTNDIAYLNKIEFKNNDGTKWYQQYHLPKVILE